MKTQVQQLPTAGKLTNPRSPYARCVAKIATPLIALVAILGFAATPASAETLSPWFHLASVSRPGNLQPEVVKDEVQDLKVTGSPGEPFVLANLTAKEVEEMVEHKRPFEKLAALEVGDEPGVIQAGLEGVYGAGNVEVTGGPGAQLGLEPYAVTFTGTLADQPVAIMNTELSALLEFKGSVVVNGVAGAKIALTAINVGDATAGADAGAGGDPIKIVDRLPSGLKALFAEGNSRTNGAEHGQPECEVKASQEVQCTFAGTFEIHNGNGEPPVVLPKAVPPYGQIEVVIGVAVEPDASSGESNEASVSGGGAPVAQLTHPLTVAGQPGEPTPFGVENYEQTLEEVGGVPDAQAGSHPFQATTEFDLNETAGGLPAALAKDLAVKLPAGLIGDPTAYPRCALAQFSKDVNNHNECPADTVLGIGVVSYQNKGELGSGAFPLYNLEPSLGEAARFGFQPAGVPVFLKASVRTGEDYGVTVHVQNIPQAVAFLSNTVTFWGVPGNSRHNNVRGSSCLTEIDGSSPERLKQLGLPPCVPLEQSSPPPFLTLPTSCTGRLLDSVEVDSWAEPRSPLSRSSEPRQAPLGGAMQALDGCGLLPFGSEIKVSADVEAASTPSGLKVDVHVPQEEALNANGFAPSDVKNLTVTLPSGVAINPGSADGLEVCSQSQIGFNGENHETHVQEFTPDAPSCPNASKIASVTITTPLLPNPLKGFAYLASPQNFAGLPENPFSSLVAMYIVARDPISGVLAKLPAKVSLNQETGQLTTTVANPQVPFEDAELEFFGGDRAPLATPALCRRPGEAGYTTSASFEPWSNTESHHEALQSTSDFNITSGPNGGPCPNPPGVQSPGTLPFAPSLASETTNINAGSFTPLSTTMSREDGQQSISSVQLHYPPGVSGLLSGVKLCPEAQANAGTCGPESEIGETIVSVGLGGDPFSVTGGKVYLTEKYQGSPFGLSIVNPAKAGPFDLQEGRPVVVRAKVEVDPHTAALTITTDSTGEHKIPRIIEGIPLQIKHVNVTITRPGFTFNPTKCNPMTVTGTITSAEGASSPVSVPFQVANCANLGFAPKFSVSTSGKSSKTNGASLTLKVARSAGPGSGQANFAMVKVDLPKQLPSRLTTLQKACIAAQFEANPAGCPASSIVGHAKIITPELPVPLEGPAYFVSHGGEAFPSLIIVLQGDGVTIDVISTTFIRNGITSGTLKALPDAPFSSFELTLPEGKHSALAANGNLCRSKLAMPTAFVAQNGLVIHQSTTIGVTGCPKTTAQKLAAALKACHKKKRKRTACETQARKKYQTAKRK